MERNEYLKLLAERYEQREFLSGDPSWFMHQVAGKENQETIAFIAAALSYGQRKQFMQKIALIADDCCGEPYRWVKEGLYERLFGSTDATCFYRLYTHADMHCFLKALKGLIASHGTLGLFVEEACHDDHSALHAIEAISRYFSSEGASPIIPKDATSACKRLCMFLRWMVRSNSPVDLGLWASEIDRRTLIIPLDTHVLQQSLRLGLISSRTASMSTAIKITNALSEIFPDDPVKGDFALFGYGVDNEKE